MPLSDLSFADPICPHRIYAYRLRISAQVRKLCCAIACLRLFLPSRNSCRDHQLFFLLRHACKSAPSPRANRPQHKNPFVRIRFDIPRLDYKCRFLPLPRLPARRLVLSEFCSFLLLPCPRSICNMWRNVDTDVRFRSRSSLPKHYLLEDIYL
ncbi:MAG: hypothetical protein ACD_65C00173G0001 [uncultured bacterium]|nr:MAG: hypothetical protein ACD_65C00173G0001 [uncultured bacterium]